MNFLKVGTLAEIAGKLETREKLHQYALKQGEAWEKEKAKIAELYPKNTVKPKPVNYCHFRLELDELVLGRFDAIDVLAEIGILDANFLGWDRPDDNSFTYLLYYWEQKYILAFPLCQDFFFITEDLEQRFKNFKTLEDTPYLTARIFAHKKDYSNEVICADAHYKSDGKELIMVNISCSDGPYLLDEEEDKEKVRNLIHYLRDSIYYDTASEVNHADLPNSVRLD